MMSLITSILRVFAAVAVVTLLVDGNPIPPNQQRNVITFELPESQYQDTTQSGQELNSNATQSQTAFGDTSTCPSSVSEGADLDLSRRSNCPWFWTVNKKAGRFPSNIIEAKTPCRYCIGSGELLVCEGITRTITVLEKGDFNEESQKYHYTEKEESFTVGYACAGGRTKLTETTPTPNNDDVDYA